MRSPATSDEMLDSDRNLERKSGAVRQDRIAGHALSRDSLLPLREMRPRVDTERREPQPPDVSPVPYPEMGGHGARICRFGRLVAQPPEDIRLPEAVVRQMRPRVDVYTRPRPTPVPQVPLQGVESQIFRSRVQNMRVRMGVPDGIPQKMPPLSSHHLVSRRVPATAVNEYGRPRQTVKHSAFGSRGRGGQTASRRGSGSASAILLERLSIRYRFRACLWKHILFINISKGIWNLSPMSSALGGEITYGQH